MNWYKISQSIIQITPAEASWAEWAIDPMFDYWCTESGAYERGEDFIYEKTDLPIIIGNTLKISGIPDINEDLLYRLEEQAPSVSKTDSNSTQQEASRSRAALSLAKKIRNFI